jgi:hypothetical protein
MRYAAGFDDILNGALVGQYANDRFFRMPLPEKEPKLAAKVKGDGEAGLISRVL